MLVDEKRCEKMMTNGIPDVFEGRKFPPLNETITTLRPFQYIYGPYEADYHDELFVRSKPDDYPEGKEFDSDPFSDQIRIRLIYEFLRAKAKDGGCGFRLTNLIRQKKILGLYPLHNQVKGAALWDDFFNSYDCNPRTFDHVKSYFGEKIALYFNFTSHLGFWLIVPAIIGAALNITVWALGNYSHWTLCFFSVIICTWSILMLEYWKRTEKENSLRWGTLDFDKTETDRPEFKEDEMMEDFIHGEFVKDPNAKSMKFVNPGKQSCRYTESVIVVGAWILLVVGVVIAIYVVRMLVLAEPLGSNAASVASGMNSIQIVIFNILFTGVCKTMTEFENQRTDTQYEDSLIGKLFFFQFVNSYSSFFFIAFVAQYLERPDYLDDEGDQKNWKGECGWEDCMYPLSVNVAIIMVAKFGQNIASFLLPWLSHRQAKSQALEKCHHLLFSPAEDEFLLTPYDPIHDSIQRYSDLAIQYGFMVLFSAALPLASLLCMIECLLSARIDLYLMLNLKQRAIPTSASDIGTWMSVFQLLSAVSIITNGGLICFTMSTLPDILGFLGLGSNNTAVMWSFIIFQWFFFSVQVVIEAMIPDVTYQTELQIKRVEFIVSKVLQRQKDDDDTVDNDSDDDDDDDEVGAAAKNGTKVSLQSLLKEYPQVDAKSVQQELIDSGELQKSDSKV